MESFGSTRLQRIARYTGAFCLVAGPLAGTLIRALEPAANPTESVAQYVIDYAARPDQARAMLVSDAFVWLMVPAFLVALSLTWRRAPALSLAAGVVSLPGWISIVMLVGQDALITQAGQPGYDQMQSIALANDWVNSGIVTFYMLLFVLGHLIGTVLLGVALWRTHAIARWAAALIAIAMPLHLIAFLGGVKPLDVGAWTMLLVGFTACVPAVLRGIPAPASQPARSASRVALT